MCGAKLQECGGKQYIGFDLLCLLFLQEVVRINIH